MAKVRSKFITGGGQSKIAAVEPDALEAGLGDLSAAATVEATCLAWLRIQVPRSGAADGAVFLADETAEGGVAVAGSLGAGAGTEVTETARRTISTGGPVFERSRDALDAVRVGQPILLGKKTAGAVVLQLVGPSPKTIRKASEELQWGLAWLRERFVRDKLAAGEHHLNQMRTAHEVFGAALDDHRFQSAALGTVTRLAQLADADRVSLGFTKFQRTRVVAVSHSAEFGKRMSLSLQVEAAMDEAVEQRAALTFPPDPNEINVTRAQGELSHNHGPSAVLTVPFLVSDAFRGAVTFERKLDEPFTADEVALLDFAVSFVGPLLWEKKQNDKMLIFKMADTVGRQTGALLGPNHIGRKLAVITTIGLVVLFSTWTQPYRASADALVEGALERDLVAPFDGFVRQAPLRAGDQVHDGELVVAMDDRDLALERLRWSAERRQKAVEYGRAVGEQKRADAEIIRTEIAQADAQIKIIDAKLARARIVAPFDGVIVSGDQSQNIGGAVTRGDLLFELAPIDDYRIALKIDEARINEITVAQTGELVVTALPESSFPFEITKLTPVAIAEDGRNFFRAEAVLTDEARGLGPGMQGVAKIDIDERLVIRNWTREIYDWGRLTLWKWFG